MMAFTQVNKDEWISGDFREIGVINKEATELLLGEDVTFDHYDAEGLGRAREAAFQTSTGTRFIIVEYLESAFPITNILVQYDPSTMLSDLQDVLKALEIDESELHFIYEYTAWPRQEP